MRERERGENLNERSGRREKGELKNGRYEKVN